ncbi:hypothetical protein CKM354_000734600 [Cercospora kikuchii]|uniref:Carboxylic ester hydrolase n=1 Tax=Cercospora kikuchii TaxID=84275 RepID=A0A9P3CJY8_9PEZI|nr:uncharacterized protein CKM354_000734600 [Cercospora kikuchii]GIZ44138.1 hypothetical protein CKM354_000734600 [Cercospora kikuchii]
MKTGWLLAAALALSTSAQAYSCAPNATTANATYQGLYKDQVETFLGIRYGQDTGGTNRFKPPRPFVPSGMIEAKHPGPACPQLLGLNAVPPYLGNVTETSEDCLRLNVYRPNGTTHHDRLPVMLYIHGGSFKVGFKDDPISQPGGIILQSVAHGHPVISVQINYRLGIFGFAQSNALKQECSENAGLRDHRLALEWVQSNIAAFGGDPDNVLIHGQSSGGLAIGMQMMAYGASKPPVFHKAIGQSQILEGGITANFTRDAMQAVADYTKCNTTELDSDATLQCLRNLTTADLFDAQNATSTLMNLGDIWLPVVDGDFLPAAPSELIATGRFYNVTTMIGWCEDDTTFYTPATITNASATRDFFKDYLPGFTDANLDKLLDLYPQSDFQSEYFSNGTLELNAEIRRAGRILRDILMTCQPVYFGEALAKAGNDVYFYDQNQTIITPLLETNFSLYGYGVPHTSELAYSFGNLSHYDIYDFPFHPSPEDYALVPRESRSWTSFAALGRPSIDNTTLQGWHKANFEDENYGIYIIGGPEEGYGGVNGSHAAREALKKQKLKERCGFLISPEIVRQQEY